MRYNYDGSGQLTDSSTGYGTSLARATGYGYDSLGRVITTTVGLDTALASSTVTRYNYDYNQRMRLAQGIAGEGVARIIPVGTPPMPVGWQGLLNPAFSAADAQLMQTALLCQVKVLTEDRQMRDQVTSEILRRAIWGEVEFEFSGWGITAQ